jgi:2-methylisocitrate lyase-like PEP mutase family enzyme
MLMNPGKEFRELLKKEDIVVAPGIYDGISAVTVEQAGFKAAYLAGAGIAASAGAEPDIGLTGIAEVVHVAKVVSTKLCIPIL